MAFEPMVFTFPNHSGWIEVGITFSGAKRLVLRVNVRTNELEYVVKKHGRKVGSHKTYVEALTQYNRIISA